MRLVDLVRSAAPLVGVLLLVASLLVAAWLAATRR
jgi:hypothetical protein